MIRFINSFLFAILQQWQLPGSDYVNLSDTNQMQVPGGDYLDES